MFDHLVDFGYFSEDKARHAMRQILAAVAYCHAENVAHRDLKVLVGRDQRRYQWVVNGEGTSGERTA